MIARLLIVIALLTAVIPSFLLPSFTDADASPIILFEATVATLPATDITPPTATLHGELVETITLITSAQQQPGPISPARFQYGTASGSYKYEISAEVTSLTLHTEIHSTGATLTMTYLLTATPININTCTTYYARLIYDIGPNPSGIPEVIYGNEISFFTPGCMTGAAGSGGQGSGTGSSSSPSGPVPMSNIVVQSAALTSTRVSPGQDVDISASATNRGAASGDASITLYINGQQVESKGVTVAAGQTAPVHFYVSRNEPGTYIVYVDSVPAGSFTVDVFTNNNTLVFGIMALTLLGIAGTLYLLVRKKTAR